MKRHPAEERAEKRKGQEFSRVLGDRAAEGPPQYIFSNVLGPCGSGTPTRSQNVGVHRGGFFPQSRERNLFST